MTGTRFARTGRCRFFVCIAVLISVLCMVAIFHSSQQQLDETRELRLRCERQQEHLNEQLQSMVEQKYNQQKTLEQERNEQMEARHSLEQKVKELSVLRTNEQMDLQSRYDKLQQAYKLLKSEHNELVTECQKSKKQLLDNTNDLEKKIQSLRSEVNKEKSVLKSEISLWKEKFNAMDTENNRLKAQLDAIDGKSELQNIILNLQHTIDEYQKHCDYKPVNTNNNDNHLNPPNIARITSPQPRVEKSFNAQVPILPKTIEKVVEGSEGDVNSFAQIRQPPANQSAASGGGKIISPLSAPRKTASTEATKSEQQILKANVALIQMNNSLTSTSTGLPPLPLPPNPRKLPENVAPIPAIFDELLKDDLANQKTDNSKESNIKVVEDIKKKDDDEANNRYANAINDMEAKALHKDAAVVDTNAANAANEDSGGHEIKDNDFMNDQNFNLPADEDKNFFDGGGRKEMVGNADEKPKGNDNDDDEGLAGAVDAGDIAVKNHNLLDTNNLNNEVAGDQGKEFPDELRLEENNEEDEDEDDYSNPAARQQGEQAIRN